MELAAAAHGPGVGAVGLLDAQRDVALELLLEALLDLTAGDVLAVLAGEGRVVDEEVDADGRLLDGDALEALVDFVRLPAKSPAFDPEWLRHGYLEEAGTRLLEWALVQPVRGLHGELLRLDGRTPLIFIEVDGTAPGTVMLYGHFDKQPELFGWETGLGPWSPVISGERVYGRGGGDDGYALFSALTAIAALQAWLAAADDFDPRHHVKRQIYLGDESFIADAQRQASRGTRAAQGRRSGLKGFLRGQSDPKAAMAQAYLSGQFRMQEIADFFAVHYSTVSRAVKAWEASQGH